MCGRYDLVTSPAQLVARFDLLGDQPMLAPRANIAPGQDNPVIVVRSPRALASMRWGLVPAWAADPRSGPRPINARIETVADKPTFRSALRKTRCLVPATGYYEWPPVPPGTPKHPVHVVPADEAARLFAFAGLYSTWRGPDGTELDTYTILTTAAPPELAHLHERMPVILAPEAEAAWLDPTNTDPVDLLALLAPLPAAALMVTPVAPLVPDLVSASPR
ncbi:MAG TPA: SOS response-associated peptidase [Chloroflexia bacterium]|nr:SOS response-associated peptidase [Chloroflexia bacterium]